ncbi:hypothetical protein ACFL2V_06420 [Pseudomonadota bacterium]
MDKKIIIVSIIIAVVAVIIFLLWPQQAVVSKSEFGSCLTQNGVIMYGVDTCDNCIEQKNILGEHFASVDYINCDFNEKECSDAGISYYPAWTRGKETLIGTQSIAALEDFSGCKLTNLP